MKKSFKIKKGYGNEDYSYITKVDLPKAYYCFINKVDMVTDDGTVIRGKDIIDIQPNWHGIMGWHSERKIDSRDLIESIGADRVEIVEAFMKGAVSIAKLSKKNNDTKLLEQPLAEEVGYYVLPDKKEKTCKK